MKAYLRTRLLLYYLHCSMMKLVVLFGCVVVVGWYGMEEIGANIVNLQESE